MACSDVYFERGRQHTVCQDYGIVGADGTVFLADGCSDSPDSDVGARILCQSALRVPDVLQDGFAVARRADNIRQAMQMGERTLDATLLVLARDGGGAVAQVWGDGAVLCRKRDGTVVAHEIFCGSSAPPYLSYLVNPNRLRSYGQSGFGEIEVRRWGDPEADSTSVTRRTSQEIGEGLVFRFNGEYEAVLVLTDGYRTGSDPRGNAVDPAEVLLEMSKLKTGLRPVLRRFRSMLWEKGWVFGDDFGAAGITFFD